MVQRAFHQGEPVSLRAVQDTFTHLACKGEPTLIHPEHFDRWAACIEEHREANAFWWCSTAVIAGLGMAAGAQFIGAW